MERVRGRRNGESERGRRNGESERGRRNGESERGRRNGESERGWGTTRVYEYWSPTWNPHLNSCQLYPRPLRELFHQFLKLTAS